jgi:hypothetical protein
MKTLKEFLQTLFAKKERVEPIEKIVPNKTGWDVLKEKNQEVPQSPAPLEINVYDEVKIEEKVN